MSDGVTESIEAIRDDLTAIFDGILLYYEEGQVSFDHLLTQIERLIEEEKENIK